MTPSAPPPPTSHSPSNIGEWLTLVFTSLLLAIIAVWTQLRNRTKRKTQEMIAAKPEAPPKEELSDNDDIAALQIKLTALQEQMVNQYDELDAKIDYVRNLAETIDRAVQELRRERGEL